MFTHLRRAAWNTSGSNSKPVSHLGWPALACHLEASPWAGLYDEGDDHIHWALRGDNETRATFAQRRA
jgi:hypothetical protein